MLALALLLLAPQDKPETRVHPFILKALSSPHALKSNFFIAADGRIVRSSVHMKREGLPAWVHAMADDKIGKGEDVGYEMEVYPDGSEVYEVYRKVGGKERQLSVKPDRTVYYIGTERKREDLPPEVASALGGLKGFEMERCMAKEGATFSEYHAKGRMGDVDVRARIGKDGKLIALQRRLLSEVEIETPATP